ncbi:Small basic protein [Pelagirhabdus alkalitolerans]|uniref:Small basic protein n=1 Tax=Pelagirhabdus alkalitolerans TaxID=1612202 RepID=A0A1G6GZZ9_9BACI|nr:small basic family protein [Pelagirhabdus alkalitolerans]SDB87627.1 Small basic protein [Pelagirhabdus alkalitolerans]
MWLPLLFLLLGIGLGFLTDVSVPEHFASYLSIAILAALDTLIGGIKGYLNNEFDPHNFLTGFFFNITLAVIITFIGDQLGVDLYLAAVVAFGLRLFNNLSIIRHHLFNYYQEKRKKRIKNAGN